ncbi:MAG: DUF2630 family protein [Actinomycetota bacterium]|nr:DUF2630 family protein [Actinomycetota bacterium]
MDDNEIHERLNQLLEEEHELRERLSRDEITPDEEQTRVREIEVERDQCWDLLRQRDALREAGRNPDEAKVRPPGEVEGYLQ